MSQTPDAWPRWFAQAGWPAFESKELVVDNYPSAIQAAESVGAMLALMPLESALVRNGRLEAPFPAVGPIDEGIYAVYKADSSKQNSIFLFVSWIKDALDQLELLGNPG